MIPCKFLLGKVMATTFAVQPAVFRTLSAKYLASPAPLP